MSRQKPKAPKYRLRFKLPAGKKGAAGTYVELSLVEAEEARLRDMARRLYHPASTPQMRDSGEEMGREVAQRLALERAMAIGSSIGERMRRAAGDAKAAQVAKRVAKGADPLEITSDRNLRRIKARRPKK